MHDLRQRNCPISTPTHCKNEWLLRGSLITLLRGASRLCASTSY
jgi:hypothetical protein